MTVPIGTTAAVLNVSVKNSLQVGQLNAGIRYTPTTIDLHNPDRTLQPGTWVKGYREGNQFVVTHTSTQGRPWQPMVEPARISLPAMIAALRAGRAGS